MQQENTTNNGAAPPMPFDVDLRVLAVGGERVPWLGALLETARKDFQPRDFAERHLVDEMAFSKWRLLRVYGMEKAVYQHHHATFSPKSALKPDGRRVEPHEDLYHLAQAFSPDNDAIVLAALSRLEARFHRQFCSALRMLIALRRFNLVHNQALPTGKEDKCKPTPSATSSAPATTTSLINSSPNSNP